MAALLYEGEKLGMSLRKFEEMPRELQWTIEDCSEDTGNESQKVHLSFKRSRRALSRPAFVLAAATASNGADDRCRLSSL